MKSQPIKGLVSTFTAKIKLLPHRDITHVPYSQWFELYVRWVQQLRDSGAGAEDIAVAKRCLNASLLSSLCARRWNQVLLHEGECATDGGVPAAKETAWWYACADRTMPLASIRRDPLHSSAQHHDAPVLYEIFTPSFLAEPILGGYCISRWISLLRQSCAPVNRQSSPPMPADACRAVIPFTSLYEIKREAHQRLHAPPVLSSATASLSLQERQARQALLQSIHQVLQLQADVDDAVRGSNGSSGPENGSATKVGALRVSIAVLPPTDEFDALMQLPSLKRRMCPESKEGSIEAAVPVYLRLNSLCESVSSRLSYIAHVAALFASPCERSEGTPALSSSVCVIADPKEQADFRFLDIRAVSDRVQVKSVAGESQSDDPPHVGRKGVHQEAFKGCGEMVRKMTVREENIRQSYSQH